MSITVETAGRTILPPEIWHDIYLSRVADQLDRGLDLTAARSMARDEMDRQYITDQAGLHYVMHPCPDDVALLRDYQADHNNYLAEMGMTPAEFNDWASGVRS